MTERTTFTAWVTKYALTEGIQMMTVEDCFNIAPDMVATIGQSSGYHFHGKDWHRTEQDAIARAEQMRAAKIASLKKSITKFEKMKFTSTNPV